MSPVRWNIGFHRDLTLCIMSAPEILTLSIETVREEKMKNIENRALAWA